MNNIAIIFAVFFTIILIVICCVCWRQNYESFTFNENTSLDDIISKIIISNTYRSEESYRYDINQKIKYINLILANYMKTTDIESLSKILDGFLIFVCYPLRATKPWKPNDDFYKFHRGNMQYLASSMFETMAKNDIILNLLDDNLKEIVKYEPVKGSDDFKIKLNKKLLKLREIYTKYNDCEKLKKVSYAIMRLYPWYLDVYTTYERNKEDEEFRNCMVTNELKRVNSLRAKICAK